MYDDNQELIRAVLAGDAQAQRKLVMDYAPLFRAIVRRLLFGQPWGSREDDLVQDVLLALIEDDYRALRVWRPDGGNSLRTFLGRFAHFRIVDRLRSRSFGTKRLQFRKPEELALIAGADPYANSQRDGRDVWASMAKLMQEKLSKEDFDFFEQSFLHEQPVPELAQRMGSTEGAIFQRRSRLRKTVVELFYKLMMEQD